MQKGKSCIPSLPTGLENKTSKKRKKMESIVVGCVKSEPMMPLAREQKMRSGVSPAKGTFDNVDAVEIIEIKEDEAVCNAGDVCNNEAAAATFTDSDAKLRPVAAAGDGTVRVEATSNNVVLALCAVPVKGTDLTEGLASEPLCADSAGDDDYPTDYWSETFPKQLLQGIPENSLQEEEIEMIPNRFYFDSLL